MKEKMEKIKQKAIVLWKKLKKMLLSILAAAVITGLGYFLYVHRRVIKAALRGESVPACKHSHCKCFRRKKK